jgi:Rrf2 family protein
MRISAKADYALRGMAELARGDPGRPVKAEQIAEAQDIPLNFLQVILSQLKHAKLVRANRGSDGGYSLSRPAHEITLADVLRAVEGPLVDLHDSRIAELEYQGAAQPLVLVWMAVRTNVRAILESVTLRDVASGRLPAGIEALAKTYREVQRPPEQAADPATRDLEDIPPSSGTNIPWTA